MKLSLDTGIRCPVMRLRAFSVVIDIYTSIPQLSDGFSLLDIRSRYQWRYRDLGGF